MVVRTAGTFADPLRTLFDSGAIGRLTDEQLLDRFATGQREDAEAAFRVLSACKRAARVSESLPLSLANSPVRKATA